MHKILLWKLFFEYKNIKKIFGWGDRSTYYFAYGANLDPSILEKRKIKVRSQKFITFPGYELNFGHPGPYKGMGFGTLKKKEGSQTYGALYEISQTDLERMDFYELAAFLKRYRRTKGQHDGISVFFYESNFPQENLRPTAQYLGYIVSCYEKQSMVPEGYLKSLRETKTVDPKERAEGLNIFLKPRSFEPIFLQKWKRDMDGKIILWFLKHVYHFSLISRFF